MDSQKNLSIEKHYFRTAIITIVLMAGLLLGLIFAYPFLLGIPSIPPGIAILLAVIGSAEGITISLYLLPFIQPVPGRTTAIHFLLRLALAALVLTLLTLSSDYIFSAPTMQIFSNFGFLTLLFGSVLSVIVAVLGLILLMIKLKAAGVRSGVLGFVLEVFILTTWRLLGAPWIP